MSSAMPPAPSQRIRYTEPPALMFEPVRTRLLDALAHAHKARPKVLSIVAPIGYGKTVLMAAFFEHLRAGGETCSWIGLDDRACGANHVLDALENALLDANHRIPPSHTLFSSEEAFQHHRIDTLAGRLRSATRATTVFIDNLYANGEDALSGLLDVLVFDTPAVVRFVWSSTTELPFNRSQARLRGLLRQIGASDLSFSADEIRALLGPELSTALGADGIDSLLRQTEGWPAAVRLAQIILADSDQPQAALASFSGADEDLSGLLSRLASKGFEPKLHALLLQLSHFSTFTTALCRHVTGDPETERTIELLLQRNLFVVRLDRNRERYRLHGLFRTQLQHEAGQQLSPEQRQTILQRAAEWCEQAGDLRDAIDYALDAGATGVASRVLDRIAEDCVRDRGDIAQFIAWFERLRTANAEVGWTSHFWYIWALIFCRRYEYGRRQHALLSERLETRGAESGAPSDLPQRLAHLRICIDLFTDRLPETLQCTGHWLDADRHGDTFDTASVNCVKSVCLTSMHRMADARLTLSTAQPLLEQVGSGYGLGWAGLLSGLIHASEGHYAKAYEVLSSSMARTADLLGEQAEIRDTQALVKAGCAVEMGLDEEARVLLGIGFRTAGRHGLVDTAASGLDAAVKLWDGSTSGDIEIGRLESLASCYPPRLSMMLCCYLIRRLLQLGRLPDALVEAERLGLTAERRTPAVDALEAVPRSRALYALSMIDLHLASGRTKQAEAWLAREKPRAQAEGRIAHLVELGLVEATLAMRGGHAAHAARALLQAVTHAAHRRIVRPFDDGADTVAAVLNARPPCSSVFAQQDERRFFAALCARPAIRQRLAVPACPPPDQAPAHVVTPTRREIELLALLDAGLSNQQLADRMNLSITTTKWHLQNLYRKLAVKNRATAVARARALNFLPR